MRGLTSGPHTIAAFAGGASSRYRSRMRRPNTITGLAWRWLSMRPRRVLALGALAIALGVAPWLAASSCPLEAKTWSAGLAEHDFLQSLSLDEGRGHYVYGYAQAVRFEARFRYRVLDGDTLELRDFAEIDADGRERALDWPPHHIGYELSEGRYCFRSPYGEERCYACRLTLGSMPMPSSHHDYYGCPSD